LRAIEGGIVTVKRGAKPHEGKVPMDSIRHFYPPIGAEVFVLGYPRGIHPQGVFPIWKRASIASEPQDSIVLSGQEYKSVLYVDAMTKAGMSGSPVVFLAKPGDRLYTDEGMPITCDSPRTLLVGVYAGRDGITQEEYELAVGRVWKTEALEELIFSHKKMLWYDDCDKN
jgi:hypothetical protein